MSKEAEHTTPAGTEAKEPPPRLATLARALIVRSKTNPRTHFDEAYIQELADSIRQHGILQPILVRPLPGSRVQETAEDREAGAPLPTHEIICGECRWRACGIAGADEIPVLVRDLTDIQVLQVQLVENLRRKDLHPLEEAEGFERLMKDHGMTVEDIAAKVNKSASQIYVTLKLLDLTPGCREELFAGKLTRSTALLVARSPAYLQVEIAREIMAPQGFDQEPMSYRQAMRHIQQHYMLQLSSAVFDIKDAGLLAKAGDCKACPKRTGANSDLFEDVKQADTCTDPKCFDAKKVAHFAQVAKAAEAKGQKVIQGKEAKELIAYEGATPKGYKLLDTKDYIGGRMTSLRSAIGKDNVPTPVVIIDPHSKAAVEALPVDVANKLLAKAVKERATTTKDKEPSKGNREREYQTAWQGGAIKAIAQALMAGKMQQMSVAIARQIALHYLRDSCRDDVIGEALGLDKVARGDALMDFIKRCPAEKVAPALLLLMVGDDFEQYGTNVYPVADLIAEAAGVDLDAVKGQVKADMKEAAAARKAEADAKANKGNKPAAGNKPQAKGTTAKKPVVSAKKAQSHAAFMAPMTCSVELQAIVGTAPLVRTDIVSKLWAYVKKHKLQDVVNKRMINADEKLKAVFGRGQVSMFEMAGLLGKHITAAPKGAPKPSAAQTKDGLTGSIPTPIAVKPAKVTKAGKTAQAPKIRADAAWPFPTHQQP